MDTSLQYYLSLSQSEIDNMTDEEWWLKFQSLEHIRKKETKT